MPIRKTALVTGHYYHVFNRGINRQPIFIIDRDYQRALDTLSYYRTLNPPFRFSHFMNKSSPVRNDILNSLLQQPSHVIIIAFCLMPNHFHLLLKQESDQGISRYLANFQNSYTKYFNAKHKRSGALLNRQFKSVLINSEEQLLHLTRYIHLNPYSSRLIKFSDIASFPYSSLSEYLSGNYHLTNPNIVLQSHPRQYRQFVLDHAGYQQSLEQLKHSTLEIPGND